MEVETVLSSSEPLCFSRCYFLPILLFSQFAGTCVWFVPNAVISQISETFQEREIAALTSLVQVGFVLGTLCLGVSTISDRFPAPSVFLVNCILTSGFNALCILSSSFGVWCLLRLLIGFCLAGIYPVGMKIAAKHYAEGLGFRLGLLIGALTCGTAFPFLVRGFSKQLPLAATLGCVSALSVLGGVLMFLTTLGEVKSATKSIQKLEMGVGVFRTIFKERQFVAACLGYWGHMWELYAFWAYVPLLARQHRVLSGGGVLNPQLTVFLAIGVGVLSCPAAGVWSLHVGNERVPGSAVAALISLMTSGICCILAPLYRFMSSEVFLFYVTVWGWSVVADSGQFSSLCAKHAPKHLLGSALMLTTCVGFTITIISIQLVGATCKAGLDVGWALFLLCPGPLLGLLVAYPVWPVHSLLFSRSVEHEVSVETIPLSPSH